MWDIQDSHGGEGISLSQVSPGQVAVVVTLGRGRETRRLAECGLTAGSLIMALGPGGTSGPVRFVLRGCCVALRAETARAVKVRPIGVSVPVGVWPCRGRALAGLSAACLLAIGSPCLAARPLDTDDPGTTAASTWCMEVCLDQCDRNGAHERTAGLTLLYGLSDRSDLCLDIPYTNISPDDGQHLSGMGDLCLTAKWRLQDQGSSGPALGLSLGVALPYGASDMCSAGVGWGVDLLAAKSIGTTGAYASLGFGRDGEGNSALAWGLACERPLGGRWGLAAEIRGDHTANEDAIGGLVGLTCHLQDGLTADFALRRDFAFGGTGTGWAMGVTREW